MLIIRKRAYARAGLLGNPSDGYFGKTISAVVRDYSAEVTLYEWDQVEIVLSQEDKSRFRSIDELARDVRLHGYYGGIRLVKATIKKFVEYCHRRGLTLADRNFSIRYQSNIPRQVGLAGSSAIIVATLRGLMEFYEVEIPLEVQPSLALSVESEELGIAAGLQDRVIQVYEGLVYMDFSRERSTVHDGLTCGAYESLDPELLPPLVPGLRARRQRADRGVPQRPARPLPARRNGRAQRDGAVRRPGGRGTRSAPGPRVPPVRHPGERQLRPSPGDLPASARTRGHGRRRPECGRHVAFRRFGAAP